MKSHLNFFRELNIFVGEKIRVNDFDGAGDSITILKLNSEPNILVFTRNSKHGGKVLTNFLVILHFGCKKMGNDDDFSIIDLLTLTDLNEKKKNTGISGKVLLKTPNVHHLNLNDSVCLNNIKIRPSEGLFFCAGQTRLLAEKFVTLRQMADSFDISRNSFIMTLQPVQPFNFGIGPISCHAWNKDRTQVAVSPNNNEVYIFAWKNGRWDRQFVLSEHDLPITGIDWAPNTNRIVTSSQDKNAFVWTFDGKSWKPELVILRLQRAATCVKWSPLENKFAVGSGSKLVSVCYYEKDNDWWLSKQIKKPFKSTVTSLDWHPNNVILAAGCCDFKVSRTLFKFFTNPRNISWQLARVFSAFVKEVDSDKVAPSPWSIKIPPFGQLLSELSNGGGGWVHDVKFSPSGNRLAWVGHDSSLSVTDSSLNDDDADLTSPSPHDVKSCTSSSKISKNIATVKEWYLPFTSLIWVSESSIVTAGYDCCPMLFTYKGKSELTFVSKLDVPSEQRINKVTAMDRFRHLDKLSAANLDTSLKTLHQNTIKQILPHTSQMINVTKFTTVGIDGQLILWDLKRLESTVDGIIVEQ
uniref:Arp2/3 complex 41 kDa subunit n=1 Tax=Romanomermis culicivorax TaxID=13658 RepID=A0A915J7Z6_ROMCU